MKKAEIKIRPARAGEENRIFLLAKRCFDNDIRRYYEPDGALMFAMYTTPEAIRSRWHGGGCMALTAVGADDELAGVIEIRDFAELTMLFVDPDWRGLGIGRMLLERMFAICRNKNTSGIFHVMSTPGAVEFYKKCGFEADGIENCECGVHYIPMVCKLL